MLLTEIDVTTPKPVYANYWREREAARAAAPPPPPWPAIAPGLLEEGRPKLPAFPLRVLPPRWREWVSDAAHWAGSSEDYVAQALLASVAGLCGQGVSARITEAWSEPVILWQALVGGPSSGKTPALDWLRRPLGAVERMLAREGGGPACPEQSRRVVVSDAAMPALEKAVARRPQGVLLWRDEPTAWLAGLGRKNRRDESRRGAFLETWGAIGLPWSRDRSAFGTAVQRPRPSAVPAATAVQRAGAIAVSPAPIRTGRFFMIKHLFLAGLLTVGASAAYAQQATTPPRAASPQISAMPSGADAKKLIGRNVKNAQDETVGEVESVYINADGKVDSVILGVGGFLGVGERHVRVAWKDLRISDNGERVVINATKDQLKAMAPYTYRDPKLRGQVFSDTGPYTATNDRVTPAPSDRMASTTATESTGDFNAHGAVSGNALIGAKVHNVAKETVGSVEDVYLDAKGAVESVVVSVGGFLGVGTKNVAVKWSDLKVGRDGKSLTLTTDWTKDSLKAMPDYKYERRQPARQGG